MTYVLPGARGSGSCAVECVLAEIGADYELRELSLRDGEHQGEEYAAVNPHRKVPSLVIQGRFLFCCGWCLRGAWHGTGVRRERG